MHRIKLRKKILAIQKAKTVGSTSKSYWFRTLTNFRSLFFRINFSPPGLHVDGFHHFLDVTEVRDKETIFAVDKLLNGFFDFRVAGD